MFGRDTAVSGDFAASLNLSSLSGADGFRLDGAASFDSSGFSVSAAGDVNGDGIGDLIVAAHLADPNGSNSGSSYVVFGRDTAVSGNFAASLDLSSLDGTDGFRLDGVAQDDNAGFSVSAAGDVNGDGISDVIVSARNADPNGSNSGSSYVVFGRDTAVSGDFAASLDLSSLDGTDGFRLDGAAQGDRSGFSVSAAGDVNGDGLGDLIVGAYGADPNGSLSGSSYVVFGRDTSTPGQSFAASIALGSLDGTDGFRLDGAATGDRSGNSVSAAGDVNGDGIDDLIVGAYGADPNGPDSGSSYVVFGSNYQAGEDDGGRLIGNVLANDTDAEGDALTVSGFDTASANGATIAAGAGDGTFVFDATTSAAAQALAAGESLSDSFTYTVSDGQGGSDSATVSVTITGIDDGDQTITGTAGDDVLFGGDGNDTLIGAGGDDLFVFADGCGDDTVNDFTPGAGTDDVLDVSAFGFASAADAIAAATQAGADTVIQLDADDSVTLLGVNVGDLDQDDFLF